MNAEAGGYDGNVGVEGAGVDIDGGRGECVEVRVLRDHAQGVSGVGGEAAEGVSGAGCARHISAVLVEQVSLDAGALIRRGGPLQVNDGGPGHGLQVGGGVGRETVDFLVSGREGVSARDVLGVGAVGEGVTGVAADDAGV